MPVKHYKAQKTWDDNKNQDGKRPVELNFELSRKVGTDAYSKVDDMDAVQETWLVDFGEHPVYDEQNREYTYNITETVPPEYTSELVGGSGVETTETNGDKIVTYTYKNTYTPKQGLISVTKNWIDTIDGVDYSSKTRPPSIEVELYCKYGDMQNFEKVSSSSQSNTHYVYDLLPANYQLRKTVTSGDSWQAEFTDLPVFVNPTGTNTEKGQKYRVSYFVKEVDNNNLRGYTVSYIPENGHVLPQAGGEVDTEVRNTLKVGKITLKKHWDDSAVNGIDDEYSRYPITLKVSSSDVSYLKDDVAITNTADYSSVELTNLPLYKSDGSQALYSVEELTNQYSCDISYSTETFYPSADEQSPVEITVTNKPKTTQIQVDKEWNDFNNKHQLRPDSVEVKLYRKPESGSAWEEVEQTGTGHDNPTDVQRTDNWSYTFTNLLKYDSNNELYVYKVEESPVNAYECTDTGGETDITNNTLTLQNTLITRTVKVKKVWHDNGFGDSLHYNIDVMLSNNDSVLIDNNTVPKTSGEVEIEDVPVFDMDGNPIVYTVTEKNRHYGYELTDTSTSSVSVNGKDFINEYTLTNTLPLTSFKVQKHWTEISERYPKTDITVALHRTAENIVDDDFEGTKTAIISTTDEPPEKTFDKLLVYDENNKLYTYSVTEELVKGYTTSYSAPQDAVKNGTETLTVTNTPIRGQISYTKIDGTYRTEYEGQTGYTDILVPNAKFKLYKKSDNSICKVSSVTENEKLYYDFDPDSSMEVITSDSDGKINLRNLPLNEYYLKEISAPDGYAFDSDIKYEFDVNVDNNNNFDITQAQTKIDNIEKKSRITLTKRDGISSEELQNAEYYLLRLIPKDVNQNSGIDKTNYLLSAHNAVKNCNGNITSESTIWKYWSSDYTVYTTNSSGQITVGNLDFGTYLFLEKKPPDGYHEDYSLNYVRIDADTIAELSDKTEPYKFTVTHEDPRKSVYVQVQKLDEEDDSPIDGAVYSLYKKQSPSVSDWVTDVTTLSDGKTVPYEITDSNWGDYYFVEKTPPIGYEINSEMLEFTADAALAHQELYTAVTKDKRKKGSVKLTKKSKDGIFNIEVGDKLPNAEFQLYDKTTNTLIPLIKRNGQNSFTVAEGGNVTDGMTTDNTDLLNNYETINSNTLKVYDKVVTDSNGEVFIDGLIWRKYYFKEVRAPDHYQLNSTPLEFTVDRYHCEAELDEVFENECIKNELNVSKTVTGNIGSRAKDFTFEVTLTRNSNRYVELPTSVDYTKKESDGSYTSGTLTVESGKVTFTLKHNEDITLTLAPDLRYSVSETDYSSQGYTTTVASGSSPALEGRTANGDMTADGNVAYTNSRQVAVPTGIQSNGIIFFCLAFMSAGVLAASTIKRRREDEEEE